MIPFLSGRGDVLGAILGMLAAIGLVPPTAQETSTPACADVDVVFARGSTEPAGLGKVGRPFVEDLRSRLSGRTVSSYAVDYAAAADQTSVPEGAADLIRHVTDKAKTCQNTRFVLGGYSQGASVVDLAAGSGKVSDKVSGKISGKVLGDDSLASKLGLGDLLSRSGVLPDSVVLPSSVAPRVAALVVFGNPLRLTGNRLDAVSGTFKDRSLDLCASGDPVCAAGANPMAHLRYEKNGDVARGAAFAADRIGRD